MKDKLADKLEEADWNAEHHYGLFYKSYLQVYFDAQSALLQACDGDTSLARALARHAYERKRFSR